MKTIPHIMIGATICLSACATDTTVKPPETLPDDWVYAKPVTPMPKTGSVTSVYYKDATSPDVKVTSLWTSSPQALFGDQRAKDMGDILTVVVEMDEQAQMQNNLSADRQVNENATIAAFFGLPEIVEQALPGEATLTPAVSVTKSSTRDGAGATSRQEKMTLRLAARVVRVAPNGYLEISGRQQIMVNDEMRYLQVTGLIRRRDISRMNTITYDKIADAKVYYGGKGSLTNAIRERSGTKVIDKVSPF